MKDENLFHHALDPTRHGGDGIIIRLITVILVMDLLFLEKLLDATFGDFPRGMSTENVVTGFLGVLRVWVLWENKT